MFGSMVGVWVTGAFVGAKEGQVVVGARVTGEVVGLTVAGARVVGDAVPPPLGRLTAGVYLRPYPIAVG